MLRSITPNLTRLRAKNQYPRDKAMSKETLRTQLDALRIERDRLEAENACLKDSHSAEAARIDTEAEVARLSKLVTMLILERVQTELMMLWESRLRS